MISVKQLAKSYGSVRALKGISFEVEQGEIIGLLGPNGAGKTTAMKILTGYLQPTEGDARVGDVDVVESPIEVQRMIGYLPENAPLYLDMLVQDYLLMMADLRQIADKDRLGLISEAVHATGLEDRLTTPIGELSKGYRQRVGLAQAIMHKPPVLILDEPSSGLDPTQIIEIRGLIKRLAEHSTLILSTHILSEVEATCDRAIIIIEGEVRADAKLDDLTQSSSAIVKVNRDASDVTGALGKIQGVSTVSQEPGGNGFVEYRVVGEKDLDLCPLIFDVAKEQSWRLAELRQEHRTLESVFRELTTSEGVQA